ncbi:MFS transporter [Fusibacter paucivorans]|uniref:MFS transporter n=1 Tax=Fusibacter paucivorans TaxID=76009 RepID=A0ABS5PN79_9FIRM|nr:MFS transporter [Fusibacter paucivorans]MBS7526634.1 MFS transporter [Fusibacter paucivorans]
MIDRVKQIFWEPYRGLPLQVYAIFFARLINAVGLFVHPLLTLIFTRKIGLSEAEAGIYVSISGIIIAVSSLIGGKVSDRYGRKVIICISDGLAAVAIAACSLFPVSMLTVYLIMVANFFIGFSDPSHNALIADVTEPEDRARAYSLTYLGFNVGFVIGPALGSLLFENHLKWLFLGDGLTLLIAVGLIVLFVKEIHHEAPSEAAIEGSIIKVLKAVPILLVFSLILMFYNIVYSQWGFLLPITAADRFSNGVWLYGILASFNGLVVILMTPIITARLSKITNTGRIFIGGIFYTVGFASFAYPIGIFGMAVGVVILTLGEIMVTISYMPYIIARTPSSHRGRMSAVLPIIIGAGYTIGPLASGTLVEHFGVDATWQIIGGIMLFSTLCMYFFARYDRRQMMSL